MPALIYQLVDVQSIFGQEVLNVFHFVDQAGAGSIDILLSDYVAHVIPALQAAQVDDLTHTAIRYREVYPVDGLTHTYTTGLPIAGTISTLPTDTATSYSNQFLLGSTVVLAGGFTGHLKRSGVRVPGPSIQDMNGNNVPGSGLQAIFTAWFAELQVPGSGAFQLCVASYLNGARVRQTTVQSYALITGMSAASMSTQNTRKVLRGRTS